MEHSDLKLCIGKLYSNIFGEVEQVVGRLVEPESRHPFVTDAGRHYAEDGTVLKVSKTDQDLIREVRG